MTMQSGVIWQSTVICFAILLIWAAYSDARSFTIPNKLPVSIALLYPAYVIGTPMPVDWVGALMVAGIVLVVGFCLFACKAFGGGDAKLMAATTLWVGPAMMFDYVFITALAGGLLAAGMWFQHRLSRAVSIGHILVTSDEEDFGKRPMPYGVALALGGLYVAFTILG